jgi:predicted XRE-type DNA-binding protein
VLANVDTDTKHVLQCVDCGKQASFYFDQWITCDCGGLMQIVVDQMNYIGKLKQYRKKKKLSQQQMAEKLGISRSYYADMEQGKKPLTRGLIIFIDKQKNKEMTLIGIIHRTPMF